MLSVEEINRLESENNMLRDSLALANNIVNKYHTIIQEIKEIAEQLLEKGLEPQSVEFQLRLKGKRELADIILDIIDRTDGDR